MYGQGLHDGNNKNQVERTEKSDWDFGLLWSTKRTQRAESTLNGESGQMSFSMKVSAGN